MVVVANGCNVEFVSSMGLNTTAIVWFGGMFTLVGKKKNPDSIEKGRRRNSSPKPRPKETK